jgi:hypothetical protein
MSSTNTHEEKLKLFKKLGTFLNSNDPAIADEIFSADWKMCVAGIDGTPPGSSLFPSGREGIRSIGD